MRAPPAPPSRRVWPHETTTPRATRMSISSSAPGSSGASVMMPNRPGREQPLEQVGVGVAPADGRVRAEAPGREERALEVDAEDARARVVAVRRDLRERGDERLLRRGDQRRQERGDAGLEQRLARAAVAVARPPRGSRRRRTRSPAGRRSPARRCRVRSRRSGRSPRCRPSTISTRPGTRRPSTSAAATSSFTGRAPLARCRPRPRVARARSRASTPREQARRSRPSGRRRRPRARRRPPRSARRSPR